MPMSAMADHCKGLHRDQQPAPGQPVGVHPQGSGGSREPFVGVERDVAAEFPGADMPPAERLGDRVDAGETGCHTAVLARIKGPPGEEFDLHELQAVDPQHGLHLADVDAGVAGARQVVGVQPDAAEAGRRGRLAAFDEGVPGRVGEAAAGQGEEAGDQFGRAQPRSSATECGRLDHEAGVLTLASELVGLDGRAGGSVVTEPLRPDLVESRPVPLQIPHDDADPHHVGQLGAGRGQDGGQVVEDDVHLGGGVLGDDAVDRVGAEQCGHVDPAAGLDGLRDGSGV